MISLTKLKCIRTSTQWYIVTLVWKQETDSKLGIGQIGVFKTGKRTHCMHAYALFTQIITEHKSWMQLLRVYWLYSVLEHSNNVQNLQLYSFTMCHWWKHLIHLTVRTLPSSTAQQLPIEHSSHMHTCISFSSPVLLDPIHMYRFYWHHIPLVSSDTGWPSTITLHSLDHMSNSAQTDIRTFTDTNCICTH